MTQPLAAIPAPGFAINTFDDMQMVAAKIAGSKMFGITNADEAFTLMLLCSSEGINPLLALRQYHMIQGRPSMRADAMVGKFEAAGGGIFWHTRTDKMAVATFYADRKTMLYPKAIERAKNRAAAMIDGDDKTVMENSHPGEVTIVRTMEEAIKTGLATTFSKNDKDPATGKFKIVLKDNWEMSGRQMLAARASTEGVRAINPGLIAGIVSEDEARDIAEQTRETNQQTEHDPSARDRAAMQAILEGHERDAAEATNDHDLKHHQGLAAEMRCRIADLDVKPGEPKKVEATVVQSAENEEPKSPTDTEPTKPVKLPPAHDTDWRDVTFAHKNPKTSSPLYNKTVGDVYANGTIEFATKMDGILHTSFMVPMGVTIKKFEDGETGAPHPKDMELWNAISAGQKHLAERVAAAKEGSAK